MPPRLVLLVASLLVLVPSTAVAAAQRSPIKVGTLHLRSCGQGLWCGSLPVPLDPAAPTGPKLPIGFWWYAARGHRTARTIVAEEGGPGYPSTGTNLEYLRLFAPLLRTHNLLLVDSRGTGLSAAINCAGLQRYATAGRVSGPAFARTVGACGRQLDHTWRGAGGRDVHASDLFGTADAADDLALVLRALRVGKVDLYGDSYGSWFAQTFASRHPDLLRTVVLDSTYSTVALSPWYASSGTAARAAFTAVCARSASCRAAAGAPWTRLAQLVARLRKKPIVGGTRDADGALVDESVTPRTLVDLINDAAFDPGIYRELDASVRAALAGDRAPLLRLAATAIGVDNGSLGAVRWYSDGLYFAVACTDYPQLFDMRSSVAERRRQLARSLTTAPRSAFTPFTPAEWISVNAYSEAYDACLDWPAAVHHRPPVVRQPPIVPASLPVLVIGGELDSWTPFSDTRAILRQLGPSAHLIRVSNSVHTPALGDNTLTASTDCAISIVRAFVVDPRVVPPARCAPKVPPIQTPIFATKLAATTAATLVSGHASIAARRAVTAAAGTVADAIGRWWWISGSDGRGLRGGRFSVTGDAVVRFTLVRDRFAADVAVTGSARWTRSSGVVVAHVAIMGPGGLHRQAILRWSQRRPDGSARLVGRVGAASLRLPAP